MESVSFRWAPAAAFLGVAAVGPLPMAKSSPMTRGLAPLTDANLFLWI